jgi:hypothetical protein
VAAISRATLRETIRFLGDFKNVRRFPSADINTEIQRKFDRFWAIVDEANEGWWDTDDTVSTVASTAYAALPATAKTVKGIDILDGSTYKEMAQIGVGHRNRYGSATGKPVAYRLSSRGIELYPTPNAVYTLRVTFTPKPDTLAESTAREWYEGWEEFVINGVILELKGREGMPLGDYAGKFEAAEKALRASSSRRRQQEPEYLNLREYNDIDPYGDGHL